MKTVYLFFSICIISVSGIFAQGSFKFKTESFDFGDVEEGPQATYKFEFTNVGDQPIIITNAQASCGCTTPDWTKEPIPPQGKGFIQATYNTQGRIGAFNKSITVYSNAVEPTKVMYIKGIVYTKENMPITYTKEQLEASPIISVNKLSHNFGKVEKNQKVSTSFKVTNSGKSDLKINNVTSGCNCTSYTIDKEVIKPNESATMTISYTPRGNNEVMDIASVLTNDITKKSVKIELNATVVENIATKSILNEGNEGSLFK